MLANYGNQITGITTNYCTWCYVVAAAAKGTRKDFKTHKIYNP